ncbi:hypothetical protein HELRODRAFT_180046 [Helobdella robusta]|uniref:Antistasin-like domain-containing protein n=1 Tax=Helobdella robusta TaxID=6412 RepID=T1FFE1_HELRO|nr:hypothetical protein HELRODRAFT_180046 [Helobdella robusta]ESN94939.1 hypothetical protein HELRODRAFT_180046 [Helobdella robusta]
MSLLSDAGQQHVPVVDLGKRLWSLPFLATQHFNVKNSAERHLKGFGKCPKLACPANNCPISGRVVDSNKCETCTCKDPCAELNCPEETPNCYDYFDKAKGVTTYQCEPAQMVAECDDRYLKW